jgi:hypothetical protein
LNLRTRLFASIIGIVLVGAFFLAPVATYSKSFPLAYAIEPGANHVCAEEAFGTAEPPLPPSFVGPPNATLDAEWNSYDNCLPQHQYPPYDLTGRSSLSYETLGIGYPPFPSRFLFTQGNYSGLVYFDGTKVAASYEFFQNVTVDPTGVYQLLNASVGMNGFGDLEFNASIKNIGSSPISGLGVATSGLPASYSPGYITRNKFNWTTVGPAWVCSIYLLPGETCTASTLLSSTNATRFDYMLYIIGRIGGVGGTTFFHREAFEQAAPQLGLGKNWVNLFMNKVNAERHGPALTENTTLDRFAEMRFASASGRPQISDYGFLTDRAAFFGSGVFASGVNELLLYPGVSAPYPYASNLQGSAPEHFAALMYTTYTQFGYYVGKAPYYLVSASCPVKEIPSAGINITQYFEGYGCTVTPVPDIAWLVIILAP